MLTQGGQGGSPLPIEFAWDPMEVTYINFGPPWLSGSCHPRSTHHLLGSEITGHGGVGGLRHVQREPVSGAKPEPAGLDDTGDGEELEAAQPERSTGKSKRSTEKKDTGVGGDSALDEGGALHEDAGGQFATGGKQRFIPSRRGKFVPVPPRGGGRSTYDYEMPVYTADNPRRSRRTFRPKLNKALGEQYVYRRTADGGVTVSGVFAAVGGFAQQLEQLSSGTLSCF